MPVFRVCATWQMCDEWYVEAATLEDAIDKVEDNEGNEFGVGGRGEYVDDSFKTDPEISEQIS